MKFTQEEKQIAKQMLKNKEFAALIEKIFTPEVDPLEGQMEQGALSLDDAHYGQNMKALAIARASFRIKMAQLHNLAGTTKDGDKKPGPIAPK